MLNAFEQLVLDMRLAQREYFRTRSPEVLNRAKNLEKQVDVILKVDVFLGASSLAKQTKIDLFSTDKKGIQK